VGFSFLRLRFWSSSHLTAVGLMHSCRTWIMVDMDFGFSLSLTGCVAFGRFGMILPVSVSLGIRGSLSFLMSGFLACPCWLAF
jgi:hypothetical protein